MSRFPLPHAAFAALATFSLSPLALAQLSANTISSNSISGSSISGKTVIEEIIVTADYRQANINAIPSSITVLDSDLITQKNAQHLEDILSSAPNVNFSSGASRARFYQIRGIGERGQFSTPLNSSVGVMIDGVDFSGIGNAATLYDVEQVEILMGPQGTRYGSNALAGLINLQSKAPTEEFHVGLQAEAGNYASNGLAGYISGPVSEKVLYRVALQKTSSDGFSDNNTVKRPTNDREETTLRTKLRWDINPDMQLDINASVIDIDNGYDAFSLDNTRNTLSDEPGFDRQNSKLLSSTLTLNTNDSFTLETIVGVAHSDIEYGYDEDWVYVGFHPYEYSSFDLYNRDRATISGEIRLVSKQAGALFQQRTSWIAGVYALQQEVDLTRIYTYLKSDFTSSYDIDRLAVYAETSTILTDQLSLEFGVRAESYKASYHDSELINFSPDENLYGGKLALNYTTVNDNLLYLSASRGYKAGGFNINGSLDFDLRSFDSEQLWNYEAGFKSSLFQNTLQTQIAVFYMDRDDVQIDTSTIRERDDNSSEFISYKGNAAGGNNYGIELNAHWLASEFISIHSSIGLLSTEYQNFVNSSGDSIDGRDQAHAPGYQYSLAADFTINSRLTANINLQAKDKFYFSDSHNNQSEAYTLLNANLSYSVNRWTLNLWGRNLTDKDYFVRGFGFGNDPRDSYENHRYTQLGEPRRIGLSVNFDY